MQIPFTPEQFFDVFAAYNTAIWPLQIAVYLLGILVVFLAFHGSRLSSGIIYGVLALFWIWTGAVYHLIHFRIINPAAVIFGILFILQGALFLLSGVFSGRGLLKFSFKPLPVIGGFFIFYALAIYPVLGSIFGHRYPAMPMFGVTPCPLAIFTFGLLLCSEEKIPAFLLIIPFLWSIIGMSAAISLRVPQDYGLAVAGISGTVLILSRNRSR